MGHETEEPPGGELKLTCRDVLAIVVGRIGFSIRNQMGSFRVWNTFGETSPSISIRIEWVD